MEGVDVMDMVSYIIGKNAGKSAVVFDGEGYTFTDPNNDGNIIITENDGEEVIDNG